MTLTDSIDPYRSCITFAVEKSSYNHDNDDNDNIN